MAFALKDGARLLLFPIPRDGHTNGAAGFALCCGPLGRFPYGAFDAGLRPGPFPDQAASLPLSLLAVTQTGLHLHRTAFGAVQVSPVGDGELMCWFGSLHAHLQHAGRTLIKWCKYELVRIAIVCFL
jgi:hypothetical protein